MRAAIYGRRSTEEHQIESLTVQVGEGTRYTNAREWAVAPEHVFLDDAKSRAEFKKRPGLISLINAAKAGAFDAVVIRDESRLGGDTFRTGIVIQDLLDAGVRLFYYFTDEEVKFDDPTAKIIVAVRAFASELEREKISGRTREHLETKARRGLNVGGRVYGYDNVEIVEGDRRVRVEYRVNVEQAAIVVEIFTRYAAGDGLKTIAKDLNRRGVPSPRGGGWCVGALHPMIARERYKGAIVWGKRAKTYRGGTKVRIARAEREWTRTEAPELRIVTDEQWAAANARRVRRESIGRGPAGGNAPRYLLSGIGRCGVCGGPMQAVNGRASYEVIKVYACSHHRERGTCANTLRVPVARADAAVLAWIEEHVLSERAITAIMGEVRRRLRCTDESSAEELGALAKDGARLRREIERLTQAICTSDDAPEALVRALSLKEGQLKDTDARMKALRTAPAAHDLEMKRLEHEARARLADLGGVLRRHGAEARKVLDALLSGPIIFVPEEGKRYRLTGSSGIRLVGVPSGVLTNLIPALDRYAA